MSNILKETQHFVAVENVLCINLLLFGHNDLNFYSKFKSDQLMISGFTIAISQPVDNKG